MKSSYEWSKGFCQTGVIHLVLQWLKVIGVFHHYYGTALHIFSLLGKSITISFVMDLLKQTHDFEWNEGFRGTTWQINDVSPVTFISIGHAVNISSVWARPTERRTLPLFQLVQVGMCYRQLGQRLEKLVQKAPAMFTVLHKPRHGTTWVAPLRSHLQSLWKCSSIMETAIRLRFCPAHSKTVSILHMNCIVSYSGVLCIWAKLELQ